MRILVLDHFFEHDIESLRAAAPADLEIARIPYDLLRSEALRILPEEVATGLEAFNRPEYEPLRSRYADWLHDFVEELWIRNRFDAFVAPSDLFFYVRALPAACHSLGVPFVVVQKETTLSLQTLHDHSLNVREHAPPIADHMTVCSERQREFWVRSGMDADHITVTGQPRFDFYLEPSRWPQRALPGRGGPTVLFLSYMLGAYHPDAEERGELPVWANLLAETEAGLWQLARRGWRVVIKPHPQQELSRERARLARASGGLFGKRVFLADPGEDVRPLIVTSDVVLGFQTTALLEAFMAGRSVVYTGWDAEAERLRAEMIPFADWGDVLEAVTHAGDLVESVERAREAPLSAQARERRRAIVEEQLGPVDGRASERTLAVVRSVSEEFAHLRGADVERRRAELATRRPPLRLRRRARHGVRRLRRRAGALIGR